MKNQITSSAHQRTPIATVYPITLGGWMVVCPENHYHEGKFTGFTNHRLTVTQEVINGQSGWLIESSRNEPKTFVQDLPALEAWLGFERAAANPFQSAIARQLLAYIMQTSKPSEDAGILNERLEKIAYGGEVL